MKKSVGHDLNGKRGDNVRKISRMYELSGGTSWTHKCPECRYFLNGTKNKYCERFPGNAEWSEKYIACKFFQEKRKKRDAQINIFDLMK